MTWTAWYRRDETFPWQPLLSGDNERELLTRTHEQRVRDGYWMVLPEGADPNNPVPLDRAETVTRHYEGLGRRERGEAAAVARGQWARRLGR